MTQTFNQIMFSLFYCVVFGFIVYSFYYKDYLQGIAFLLLLINMAIIYDKLIK